MCRWYTSLPFDGGLFAGFAVFSDAKAVEPTGNSPSGDANTGFVATEVVSGVGHLKVAWSTGNLAPMKLELLAIKELNWRPHGDSNPGYIRERDVS
jgi:hypothetical protein